MGDLNASLERRYSPVLAIEVEGLLELPVVPGPAPDGVIEMDITMHRNLYPTGTRPEPKWDRNEEWTGRHWFSERGVAWVKSVLDQTEVVWASSWREYANVYFAEPLGLPRLPVGVRLDGGRHQDVPSWKADQLARQFEGRPLLWVTDELPAQGGRLLASMRNPRDRFFTATHFIPLTSAVSDGDVQRMDRWLELTRTEEGHTELRWLRKRQQERARTRRRERE